MSHRHSTVIEAYSVLGLEQSASLEIVKSTYKQLALRTHPDKNPGDEAATAQFQRLSEAYSVLLKHLDRPSSPPLHHPHSHAHTHSHTHNHYHPFEDYDYDDYDDYDYYDDEYDDYDDYDPMHEERMHFYMYLFEELLRGHARAHAHARYRRSREDGPAESSDQFSARLRKAREQQEQAEARRAQEEVDRKENLLQQRDKERREAEERQRQKASAKKAEAEASRKSAENKARQRQEQLQTLRSKAFAAARRKDSAAVKKAVWEENVDAAGGEIRQGAEAFVKNGPADPEETLMHIAAKNGDLDLVEWLDSHSADSEERNGEDMTAFHIALRNKHSAILLHFFEAYPPTDEDYSGVYRRPEGKSNLQIALDTREPELIWMVLDKKLHAEEEMDEAWQTLASPAYRSRVSPPTKYEEIVNLFTTYGKYTPPAPEPEPVPVPQSPPADPQPASSSPVNANGGAQKQRNGKQPRKPRPTVTVEDATPDSEQASPQTPSSASPSSAEPCPHRGRGRGRGNRGRPFQPRPQHQQQPSPSQPSSPSVEQTSAQSSPTAQNWRADGVQGEPQTPQQNQSNGYRGRGRGRGQWRGRGRGRGRGQAPAGAPPSSA
ncbi:hypothetical protein GY45DRAFT_1315875 [Cubamyces sp. BRFM 1775]|nr:hypothetical protein GY45DRAFT_1315875 [Cubamyces sp. BRFM 1775]